MLRNWQTTHRMIIRHDPKLGHRYVKNTVARVHNELGGAFVKTNAQGFRSDLDFKKTKGNKPRILFFGDSFTAGDLCNNEQRFAELVGESLGAEVYNYGLSGSGTDQQLLAFEECAKDVEADLIVLMALAENIERNKVANRTGINRVTKRRELIPKPYFVVQDDQSLLLKNSPVPVTRREIPEEEKDRFGSHNRDPRLRLVYDLVDFYRQGERLGKVRDALEPMVKKLRPHALRLSGYQPFPDYLDLDSEGWRLMAAIVRRFAQSAKGTPLLVIPLPTYHNIKDDVPPVFQDAFCTLHDAEAGLFVGDVATAIAAMPRSQRARLVFEQDVHFSPHGHRTLSELVAQQIERFDLLGGARRRVVKAVAASPTPKPLYVLGISGFYHNSAAALVREGRILAAAEEERFTRVKNDRRFPKEAVNYCLEQARINPEDLAAVVYYDNAAQTFERLMHTQIAIGSKGADNWQRCMPSWVCHKLHIPRLIREQLKYDGLILHDSHHRSHAASAFYPSPFTEAAVLTIDGVGEWATASISVGDAKGLRMIKEMRFPHSLGLLYSAFTQFTGFKVNSGEYKMMGLAPYGEPKYVNAILEHLVDLKDDGSLELNMDYFAYLYDNRMTSDKFAALFGGPARPSDAWITQREMDLARSIQVVTQEAVLRMARFAKRESGKNFLCMAGGVALNCVANGVLQKAGIFDDLFIQPAAGDSGGALGAALDATHEYFALPRAPMAPHGRSLMGSSLLGPSFSSDEVVAYLESNGYPYQKLSGRKRAAQVAALLDEGKVVGHFAGRLEYGPRALGARSILGDARNQQMQVTLNLKIKYRESFRPFAPSCLEERVADYFEMQGRSPYMLLVAPVQSHRCLPQAPKGADDTLTDIVKRPRSDLPAITHIDYSARVQTVCRDEAPVYYDLIKAFEERTGVGVIVNTSFNVRGEPIVCTPGDAYRCFMRTDMDVLVLEDCFVYKDKQPPWPEAKGHVEFDVETQAPVPPALLSGLARIFERDFLPAARAVRKADGLKLSLSLGRDRSGWVDVDEPKDMQEIFKINKALEGRYRPAPETQAAALLKAWSMGPAREAMRPVLEKILALGQSHQSSSDFDEEVSDAVYVMF